MGEYPLFSGHAGGGGVGLYAVAEVAEVWAEAHTTDLGEFFAGEVGMGGFASGIWVMAACNIFTFEGVSCVEGSDELGVAVCASVGGVDSGAIDGATGGVVLVVCCVLGVADFHGGDGVHFDGGEDDEAHPCHAEAGDECVDEDLEVHFCGRDVGCAGVVRSRL